MQKIVNVVRIYSNCVMVILGFLILMVTLFTYLEMHSQYLIKTFSGKLSLISNSYDTNFLQNFRAHLSIEWMYTIVFFHWFCCSCSIKKNFLSFLEFLESTSFSISVVIRYLLLLKNWGPGRSNTKNSWIKNNKLEENNMVSELSRLYFFEVIFINVLLETLLSFPSVKYYY